jgi:hypothetical protein
MTPDTLKEYHFTDEQIDTILRLVRSEAFTLKVHRDDEYKSYDELANQIEDQIVNHPTND